MSVTASYVMRKCRTEVFMSVFCNAKESMKLQCDEECHRDNAVSLYYLEILHFTLVEGPKVSKNNVGIANSALPKLCILFVF